jgi:competence protein ComEA
VTTRIGLLVGALVVAVLALWHPAPRPAFSTVAAPTLAASPGGGNQLRFDRGGHARLRSAESVVYVAGAVRRPGLYHVRAGDRAADAVALAGGMSADADSGEVNLAARAADGDEIYVPVMGESTTHRRSTNGARRHGSRARRGARNESLAPVSVDVNAADASELARVPGIGKSVAARIVEMRLLDGSFRSLDELLDVAGMTQTRLERARPYLRLTQGD